MTTPPPDFLAINGRNPAHQRSPRVPSTDRRDYLAPVIALARKYRPRRFADLLVQDHVAAALRGAISKGRVGHGYLLTGPRGVGKTTAARILAMALNCERQDQKARTGEPCGECDTCQRIWSGSANLDVVELDAASNRGVDDARDLRERAMYAASQEDRYKVYIVDEAHMLTREAWNALLKILEEPPPRVVFVFATTEPQKIANNAAPVLSRLQRFDFKRIGAAAIRDRLTAVLAAEGLLADDDAIAVIARYADGGMRDALSVLDQALSLSDGTLTADRVRQALGLIGDDVYAEVLGAVARKDAAAIFPVVDRLLAAGTDLVEFANGMAELLRSVLMVATGAVPDGLTGTQRVAVTLASEQLAAGDVLRMLGLLSQVETSIRRSANPRLVVETLLLRWALMDRTVDLELVLSGVGSPGLRAAPASAPAPIRTPRPETPVPVARGASAVPSSPTPVARSNDVPPTRPAGVGAFTLESIAGAWPGIVVRAKDTSPLLATVLEHLRPVGLVGNQVSVVADEGAGHMVEGAKRQLGALEDLVSSVLGQTVVISVQETGVVAPTQEKSKRLSEKDLRAEKLREFRAMDATLDAAADALDLEIVD